jgi:hypothetical protein
MEEASKSTSGAIWREVAMRLSFFFKLCGLFVQTKSPNALRALLWAGHRG